MDHTVEHCRDNFWYPKLPLRAKVEAGIGWYEHSARILEKADERWRNAIATYQPIDLSDDKRRNIEQVLADARRELL
jgi:trimethylamine:corrinoid methyltransferase-like protein